MLTATELAHLLHRSRGVSTLSVYLAPSPGGAVGRRAWHRALRDLRTALERSTAEVPAGEHELLARAADRIETGLPSDDASPPVAWAAFASPDELLLATPLWTPVAPVARWTRGAVVSPCLLATACAPRVLVTTLTTASARLFRYTDGALRALPPVHVEREPRERTHMGGAPRPGFHVGTRGETASEAAQRRRRTRRHRLVVATGEQLVRLMGAEEWLVVGGVPQLAEALRESLAPPLTDRAICVPGLHGRATAADVTRAALAGAALLRGLHDLVAVDDLLERYGADGRGAAGPDATWRALAAGAVHELLVTRRFHEQHPGPTESAVRATLEHGGQVRPVGGAAAERLEAEGQGIGALLRFAPGSLGAPAVAPTRGI